MRRTMLLLCGLLLAGCDLGGASTTTTAPRSAATTPPPAPVPTPPRPTLEPTQGQPFFVGRWAAEEGMCGDAAWVFTQTRLETPGHVVCNFDRVTRVAEGYDVAATCTAEAPPAPYRLELSYAQSAQALLVDGGPFNPIGLVSCGS